MRDQLTTKTEWTVLDLMQVQIDNEIGIFS